MKKVTFLFVMLLLNSSLLFSQGVAINADGSAPDASAVLDVSYTTKGFLPPRVALTAANVASPVTSPATGLFLYNTATSGTPPNNVMPGYYCWNGTRWVAVIVPQGTNPGDMLYWNGTQWVGLPAGSNGQILTFNNGIPAWQPHSSPCGFSMTINHVAGTVAPVNKLVTYGTVTNIPGELSKCWITSNLGADHQATAKDDATEQSAGWYWQFNRMQGYKHDGTTRTPNTTWITSINENSDWLTANDPCALLLGAGWRIPTITEWTNVDASGGWTNWNGPWNSALKMHAAGDLSYSNGSLFGRGGIGVYWSSSQANNYNGWRLFFFSGSCNMVDDDKAYGRSSRCLRD